MLLSVDGSSGPVWAHLRTHPELLKRNPCRIATTLNEAEVKQRKSIGGLRARGG